MCRCRHPLSCAAQSAQLTGVYVIGPGDELLMFGVIKSVLGFRQFSMRGLAKARGEWSLVTMAWNVKRMFALAPA